jgi:hypothetical protein
MTIGEVHLEISDRCLEVARLFKPGAKVTILIRTPSLADGDMVVTDDDIDLAVAALQGLKQKEERKISLEDLVSDQH